MSIVLFANSSFSLIPIMNLGQLVARKYSIILLLIRFYCHRKEWEMMWTKKGFHLKHFGKKTNFKWYFEGVGK